MKWISSVLAFLGLMGYCSTSNAVSKAEFDAALKQADRDKETKAGTNRALPFLILTP